MRRLELATAFIVLLCSGWMIYAMSAFNYWVRLVPGPAFMPIWLSILAIGLAVALAVVAWRKDDTDPDFPKGKNLFRIVVIYVALWGVVLASEFTGFLLASIAFLLFSLLFVLRRPLVPSLATTGVVAAMVHFLFNAWLDVRLPTGLVGF